jgi:predicted transcriptional regulator
MKKYKENREKLNNLTCDPEEPEEKKESIKIVENDSTKTSECNVKPKVYRLPKGNLRLLTCVKTTNKAECKRNSTTEDSKKKQIGFYMNNQDLKVGSNLDEVVNDFSNEDLQEYLTYIFENKVDDNISPGQNKISDNTNLSLKKVRAIRYFLEDKNIIKIDKKITYINTNSINESLNIITSKPTV